MSSSSIDSDVIILTAATSAARVCGLTLSERARRVAVKAGAARVLLVGPETPSAEIEAWAGEHPERKLIVLDATDHVIHVPLVQTLVQPGGASIVVDETGRFAGAMLADGPRRAALVAAASSPASLTVLAETWRSAGIVAVPHGELCRHPARTPAERRAAVHFLFGLIRKAQDSWLVRNFNRKVSYPFTRMLLPFTRLSPNMISIAVFLIGVIGCYVLTTPTYEATVLGTGILLFAGYLDGCDGEIARIRLESSKLGAWLDTLADEATTVISITCFGIHIWRVHEWSWMPLVIVASTILSVVAVASVYYYLLTSGTGSGNSQDYPTTNPILGVLRYLIRREVINLASFFACLLGLVDALYAGLVLGSIVSSLVLVGQQVGRYRESRAKRTKADLAAYCATETNSP